MRLHASLTWIKLSASVAPGVRLLARQALKQGGSRLFRSSAQPVHQARRLASMGRLSSWLADDPTLTLGCGRTATSRTRWWRPRSWACWSCCSYRPLCSRPR